MSLESQIGENQMATTVIGSAHQIWLAGLGAVAKAEKEGSKFFDSLVEEGEKVEAGIKEVAERKVEGMRDKAADTWNKLEEVFQRRVARALKRLGVPTKDDIQSLYRQVEELRQNIEELSSLKEPNRLGDKSNV
jgi:poly(hydroxyalkanoate) granule-associated protein